MFYYYFGCEKLLKSKKGDKDSQERFIYTANTCLPLLLMHFLQKEKKYIFQGYFSSYHCTNQEHFSDAKNPLWSCFEKPQGKKNFWKKTVEFIKNLSFVFSFSYPAQYLVIVLRFLLPLHHNQAPNLSGFQKYHQIKCLKNIWTPGK